MLRFVLIGASVLGTALVGYFAKRKFFNRSEELPSELKVYPPNIRPKGRRGRRAQFNEVLDNGQLDSDPA